MRGIGSGFLILLLALSGVLAAPRSALAAGNQPPVVNAGPDLAVTLPSSATLNGTVTDDGFPIGSTLTILWSKVSGPGTVSFSNPNTASTTASFSSAGTYVLKLSASDSELSASDEVVVTVSPANQPPVELAALDQLVLSFGLDRGRETSLRAKLKLECGPLGAFANEVRAQAGKDLTEAQAAALLARVAQLRSELGCPSTQPTSSPPRRGS